MQDFRTCLHTLARTSHNSFLLPKKSQLPEKKDTLLWASFITGFNARSKVITTEGSEIWAALMRYFMTYAWEALPVASEMASKQNLETGRGADVGAAQLPRGSGGTGALAAPLAPGETDSVCLNRPEIRLSRTISPPSFFQYYLRNVIFHRLYCQLLISASFKNLYFIEWGLSDTKLEMCG